MNSDPTQTPHDAAPSVDIHTVAKFLLGDREAILALASAPGLLGIGVLFVFSAALAREYDGVYFLAEPWHLALPLAASLGTSFLLFCLLFCAGKRQGIGAVPFGRCYLRFLGLYWMTAPLAWLYAIPVERFLTPLGATQCNLALLGLVAAWRVALIVRVAQVLFGANLAAAFSLVLAFADTVALAALAVSPKPVIVVMAGISHTDSEIAIFHATLLAGAACLFSYPVWLLSCIATVGPRRDKWKFALEAAAPRLRPDRGLWALAIASVAVWAFVLPITQSQQRLAYRVDRDLKAGRIAEALRLMAEHKRSDFPAHWDPPPRIGYGNTTPSILIVLEAVLSTKSSPWVQAIFREKFGNSLYNTGLLWSDGVDDKTFHRYVNVILQLPEGPSFASRQSGWLRIAQEEPGQSEARRADIQALLDLAETYDPDKHPEDNFARSF